MVKKKISALLITVVLVGSTFTGCKTSYTREFVDVTPSQTAFLVPKDGKTSDQAKFGSEDLLKQNMIASKRVEIPYVWEKKSSGGLFNFGHWVKSHELIVVERKPISREWTNDENTGTKKGKQGIKAETKESIAFSTDMNCAAQIDEGDASKFLYLYNGLTLDSIMDTEIRSRIETKFAELCSKYALSDLLLHKEDVMKQVRDDVMPYFKGRGINITLIGIKGDFAYDNKAIQESIDNTFKAQKEYEAQKTTNQKNIEKAEADAKAVELQAKNMEANIRLKELEVKQSEANAKLELVKKWNGVAPLSMGGSSLINLPLPVPAKEEGK